MFQPRQTGDLGDDLPRFVSHVVQSRFVSVAIFGFGRRALQASCPVPSLCIGAAGCPVSRRLATRRNRSKSAPPPRNRRCSRRAPRRHGCRRRDPPRCGCGLSAPPGTISQLPKAPSAPARWRTSWTRTVPALGASPGQGRGAAGHFDGKVRRRTGARRPRHPRSPRRPWLQARRPADTAAQPSGFMGQVQGRGSAEPGVGGEPRRCPRCRCSRRSGRRGRSVPTRRRCPRPRCGTCSTIFKPVIPLMAEMSEMAL